MYARMKLGGEESWSRIEVEEEKLTNMVEFGRSQRRYSRWNMEGQC
jgi:hypothetical protein